MTAEHVTLLEPSDLRAVRIVCVRCRARFERAHHGFLRERQIQRVDFDVLLHLFAGKDLQQAQQSLIRHDSAPHDFSFAFRGRLAGDFRKPQTIRDVEGEIAGVQRTTEPRRIDLQRFCELLPRVEPLRDAIQQILETFQSGRKILRRLTLQQM